MLLLTICCAVPPNRLQTEEEETDHEHCSRFLHAHRSTGTCIGSSCNMTQINKNIKYQYEI
jgi:hypothetical protein